MRLKFPEESKFPWLPLLLDAYEIIDNGVEVAINEEENLSSKKLACKKGCDNCCSTHKDIPLYPHELVGIYWYTTEKITKPLRDIIKKQLSAHAEGAPCPFLIDSSCAIHPIRPASCRQFNVFSRQCEKGEDPYYTRRPDVLTPIEAYTHRAFSVILLFYGVNAEENETEEVINTIILTQASNLQSHDWKKLVRIMENFDSKNLKV